MDSILNIVKGGSDITLSDKNFLMKVIVISILIVFVFTYIYPNNYGFIIILIAFTLWIVGNYISYSEKSIGNTNNQIMYHLNVLQETVNVYIDKKLRSSGPIASKLTKKQVNEIYNSNKLSSLYIDSNLIEFLYSIKQLSEWNDSEFYLLLKGTNNILRLRKEIEEYYEENKRYPTNVTEMFEQSVMLRSNTINNLHRFIFAVPKTNMMYDYTNKIIKRYMVLISRNTDKIYEYVQDNIKITGINTTTKFVSYNNIRPYDPSQTADYYT